METNVLKAVGQIAGIGGLAIGMILIIFREIIRKKIFPILTKEYAYRLLMTIVILSWTIALGGIIAWAYVAIGSAHNSQQMKLRVRITNDANVKFSGGDKFISAEGSISGIVSDPYATVYLLGRRIHQPLHGETYWLIWKAVTDADGNWKLSFYLPSSGIDFPLTNFWEFFSLATKRPEDVEKYIISQAGAIREEDLRVISTAVSSETIIRVHSEGFYVDPSSIPKSRKVFSW